MKEIKWISNEKDKGKKEVSKEGANEKHCDSKKDKMKNRIN